MVDLLKTFLSREVEKRIDEYLHKMKTTKFLSELNLDLNSNYISLKSYSINDLENLKSIWLDVANLSAYLYVEFEFFRQFSFPNRYESQIYEDCLKKLGYKQHEGIWKIDQIPNKQCIIENIFYSYFYMFLCQEKKIELDNEKFMNENAENSIKLENLCNPSRNVNNTIDGEIPLENIDHVVLPIIGEMGNIDNNLCEICHSEVINGICTICMNPSDFAMTDQLVNDNSNSVNGIVPIREEESMLDTLTNVNKTCSNLNSFLLKSEEIRNDSLIMDFQFNINPSSSDWTCNVSSYNQNNNSSSTNCEVCLSSKFAKINSRAFESLSSEVSNENRVQHDADNKDKWSCTQCTFINKISVDLCEICLAPNINKIGTINDNKLPEEIWCCKRCGENNSFECYKCKNCRVPAEFFNKWRCEQCSYYNDKVVIRCGACEIGNPYLMKCNICSENLVNKKYDKICKECTILVETIDYQDNGKMQSVISEIENVPDKRNEINANQNNSTNNVSENVETKRRDSIVYRRIHNEETGNSKIDNIANKIPSETSKFNNSLSRGDENSGNPEQNEIKLKNDVSQKIETKPIFSIFGGGYNYKKPDNLTVYKFDKTQSERSGSNKSLYKGDLDSGKLIETRLISNEDNQQKPENKKVAPPIVTAMNKKNLKPCKNCKSTVCANNQYWCTKCEYSQWYCQNKACDVINFRNHYCKQCTAKMGSDFSNCANFWVMKDGKEVQMWQCGFCLRFIAGTLTKCKSCKNHRDLPNYKKCKCNWNNLTDREKCDKCNADLIPIIKL